MKGTSITLRTPSGTELDRFGNEQHMFIESTVDDVLIVPGPTELLEASRPEGVQVAYTLHFPKTFSGSLAGCEVELPTPWTGVYRVIGEPGRYMDANTPTRWNMPVEVEKAYG
jgi:hypothetical protein